MEMAAGLVSPCTLHICLMVIPVVPPAPSCLALHKLEFRITLGTQLKNFESFE